MSPRVPILGQDDVREFGRQPINGRNNLVALRHGERPAGTEIVLHIDNKKDIAIVASHCAPRNRGMISRAMSSTWSGRYLYGMKISFWTPAASWARNCATHSSIVPKIAASLVESLQAA